MKDTITADNFHHHALSPLDGRYRSKVHDLSVIFSESSLIQHRAQVELQWLKTLAQQAAITALHPLSDEAEAQLATTASGLADGVTEVKAHEARCNHDVKAVEYYLKAQLQAHPATAHMVEWVHFACTSEDINNIAYALMVKTALHDVLCPQILAVIDSLQRQAQQYAAMPMLARTHGQAATPTTLGKEMANTAARLQRTYEQLQSQSILAKCNGAVGNYNAHHAAYPELDWPSITANMLDELGLTQNPMTTQIEPHDWLAELSHTMIRLHNILLDFAQDTWHDISRGYFILKRKDEEVGSSTMPHKINPIDFENAEGNLGLANALLNHFANKLTRSRWQRDLSDSTVLRNVGSAFGYAAIAYQALQKGLGKIAANPDALQKDLDQHWEVLTEAIQTLMRREGLEAPYEQLKALSRGQNITQDVLVAFIKQSGLSEASQQQLLAMSPSDYTGLAARLALRFSAQDAADEPRHVGFRGDT